jgi:type I restriction enzyme S subunit
MSDQIAESTPHGYQRYLQRLPTDWSRKEIRQIGTVVGGGTPSRDVSSFWRGNIPWVTPGEVSGNTTKFLYKTKEHISASGLIGSGANLLPPYSLMITTRATLGARAINAVAMATNQGFKSIAFKQAGDSSFYFHVFEKVQPELVRRASGTTFLEISAAEFAGIEVPSPSPDEKSLITEILDTLDTAIHETEAIIAKLKAVKQGLLHDLLTRGINANGELRPTQAEAPDLYKESPLGWIPLDWSCEPLSDLLEVKLGFAFSSHDYVDDGILSFRVTNIGQPSNGLGGVVKLPRDFLEKFPKQRLDGGEIMIVMVGATTGKMGRVPHAICPALQNQNMWNLVPNEKLDREFAWIALPSLVDRHLKQAQGSARDFLTQSAFLVEFLGVPPLEEQAQISVSLGFIEKRIEAETDLLNKLLLQKNALMEDLLTGRVRVTSLLAAEKQGST